MHVRFVYALAMIRLLRSRSIKVLRRVPSILSLPPGHPGSIPIRRRGRRVGLEAEFRRRLGDAVDKEVLVLVIAVFAHDGAELGQLAVQDSRDRVALEGDDLVEPVGEQRDVGRERQGRARDVRTRVHGREVEDVRGWDQDLGQEGVHGDPEDQREAAEPDPLPLRPCERGNRAGQQQGERAVPRVVSQGVVQECVVPQVVGDHPRPHHVHPDEASHGALAGRGHDDLAQARDRDDVEQAGRGGQEVPVAADRAEPGLRVDADVAGLQVGGDLLIPLRRVQLGGHSPGLGQADDHVDGVRVVDTLQALPVGAARVVCIRVEVDRQVADVGLHDVDGQADPQGHAQPDRVLVCLDGVAFRVDQDRARHGGGEDHDRVLTEGEPAHHGCPVDPRVGHEGDAADGPHGEDGPVPPAVNFRDGDLGGEHEQPDEIDLGSPKLPEEKRVHSILL